MQIINAHVLCGDKFIQQDFWVENGKVSSPLSEVQKKIDAKGSLLIPGFIDIQINGGHGIDLSSEPERVSELAEKLPCHGCTAFLPTLVSSHAEFYKHALPKLCEAKESAKGAQILGIHLEGPFIAASKKGAHDLEVIPGHCRDWKRTYHDLKDVRIVTLAPELEGADHMIKELAEKNIIVSAGHSNASSEEAEHAASLGINLCTHLYNCMSPLHHRAPGLVGTALTYPDLYFTLIADGVHLDKRAVQLAYKMKPEFLIGITDAMAAMGLGAGSYQLGEMSVDVNGERATISGTETLAGSIATIDHVVKQIQSSSDCSLAQAIRCVTLNPARLLGIDKQKGSLEIGMDADFVLCDKDLNIQATFVAGEQVF
ncbi:MAG: N-acetylglucosamine-6-phosphate deacetylase [Waddliaceae bacterium]|nr:N-acetylglucosamine-6-phosphate deacetylase [Waddliaceae bacterium]